MELEYRTEHKNTRVTLNWNIGHNIKNYMELDKRQGRVSITQVTE